MEILISIAVAVVVIGIISAFLLLRPKRMRGYDRMVNEDYHEPDADPITRPIERPIERPRPVRVKSLGNEAPLIPLLVGVFRAVIGLAAVGVLAYIFQSSMDAAKTASDAALTRVYTEGIFKAVVTIGITIALYIFTKFSHR